jgi:CheY-like chemotaxis protein
MTALIPILVAEDEAILLLDIETSLQDGGYTVLAAANAEEALRILEGQLDEIRALVTDIDLGPRGMTGWDVAQRARESKPELPVVYMTGASAHEWASRGVPNSILLGKPFAIAQLLTAVSQLLNQSNELPHGE